MWRSPNTILPRNCWTPLNFLNVAYTPVDFIAIPIRFRTAVKYVKAYPGADVPSDHKENQ